MLCVGASLKTNIPIIRVEMVFHVSLSNEPKLHTTANDAFIGQDVTLGPRNIFLPIEIHGPIKCTFGSASSIEGIFRVQAERRGHFRLGSLSFIHAAPQLPRPHRQHKIDYSISPFAALGATHASST